MQMETSTDALLYVSWMAWGVWRGRGALGLEGRWRRAKEGRSKLTMSSGTVSLRRGRHIVPCGPPDARRCMLAGTVSCVGVEMFLWCEKE
jgi:hypothetical protein